VPVTVAALGMIVTAGCGEDEAPKTGSLRITVTEPSPDRFRYRAPRSVQAGLVKLTLVNRGKDEHKAQLWRIQGDHSVKEALGVRRPLPDWLLSEGGVGETPPGGSASVVQRLRPGRYYIADSGGDKGRVAPFEVKGEETDAELPSTAASIVTKDYSFTPTGLKAGNNSVEISNEGFEPHHTVVAPVKRGGSSVAVLRRFLKGTGPIPVGDVVDLDKAEETSVIEQGQRQVVDLRLKRGTYALLCFVPDRKGGATHVAKGMVDKLTVR
jgi:hypothetical protein